MEESEEDALRKDGKPGGIKKVIRQEGGYFVLAIFTKHGKAGQK